MTRRKDGALKGHVLGMKNNMRIPEEKLAYILEWQKTNMSQKSFAKFSKSLLIIIIMVIMTTTIDT